VHRGAADNEIRMSAIDSGMRPIGEDGLAKVLEGQTTLDEVTRVVYLPEQGVKVCAGCAGVISKDFEYCPTCGHFVGEHCERCRRRTNTEWQFCPSCGHGRNTAATRTVAAGDSRVHPFPGMRRRST